MSNEPSWEEGQSWKKCGGAKSDFIKTQRLRKHLSRIYMGSKSDTLPHVLAAPGEI